MGTPEQKSGRSLLLQPLSEESLSELAACRQITKAGRTPSSSDDGIRFGRPVLRREAEELRDDVAGVMEGANKR